MSLKEKIFREMTEYWINVFYLTLVFAAFTQYRRLVLATHDITYTNYGVALIEALIMAKVIMIGDVLRIGRYLEYKPLIFPTLLKTVVFCLFIGLFTMIEHTIKSHMRQLKRCCSYATHSQGLTLRDQVVDPIRQGLQRAAAQAVPASPPGTRASDPGSNAARR